MTAKGKINASKVQAGDRIIIKSRYDREGHETIAPSANKTGEGVHIARVIGKQFRPAGIMEARGWYVIETTAGSFEAAPIQTMWLAPEDAAGIKRARIEADLETVTRRTQYVTSEVQADPRQWATEGTEYPYRGETPGEQVMTEPGWRVGTSVRTTEAPALIAQGQDTKVMDAALAKVQDRTGSAVVRLLEKVWTRIREDHPELPEVVIVTGSGGGSKWGHFRADGWKVREEAAALHRHELFLAGEALAKGAHQVLQTMLHEGAHTLARVRDLQDTSRQGRWHNGTFRKLAEEMGLEHKGTTADKGCGWSFVTLKDDTRSRYADLVAELDREISLTCHLPGWLGGTGGEDERGGERMGVAPKGEGEKPARNEKAVCQCDKPKIIRLSDSVLSLRVVRCDDCEQLFARPV